MEDIDARVKRLEQLTLPQRQSAFFARVPGAVKQKPWNDDAAIYICQGCGRWRSGADGPFPEWDGKSCCAQCLPVVQWESVRAMWEAVADLEFAVEQLLRHGRKKARRYVEELERVERLAEEPQG